MAKGVFTLEKKFTEGITVPAVHYHRLVLPGPFGPYQSHKVQKVSGVIGDTMVWPSQVLNLGKLPLLLTLGTHRRRQS